jgi:hypothetical protein
MEGTGVAGTVARSEVEAACCVDRAFNGFDEFEKCDVIEVDYEGITTAWTGG